jgi:hypothetical protein
MQVNNSPSYLLSFEQIQSNETLQLSQEVERAVLLEFHDNPKSVFIGTYTNYVLCNVALCCVQIRSNPACVMTVMRHAAT